MKKLLFTLLAALTTLQGWGLARQYYTSIPDYFPEAFEWEMIRDDYRGDEIVKTSIVKVIWEPNFERTVSGTTYYGRLTVENFYDSEYVTVRFDLHCINDNFFNFKWSEDGKTCTFSFCATTSSTWVGMGQGDSNWGMMQFTQYKYGTIAGAQPSSGSSSKWWTDGTLCPYAYAGGQRDCVLDFENKKLTINVPWGCFMRTGNGTGSSSVVDYYTRSQGVLYETTLNDIVTTKRTGDQVTVADDLVAVKLVGVYGEGNNPESFLLYAKDDKKFAQPDAIKDGQKNYMVKTGVFPDEYDQSNWVALSFEAMETQPDLIQFDNLIGHVIKGGTIKGTYTDDVNPTIAVTQLPTGGVAETYEPNVYIVPSFCDEYVEEGSQYFFVQPKPQEYCTVQWANYDATTNAFYVPASENGNNGWDLSGGFEWQTSYLPSQDRTPVNQGMYTFPAIVKRKSTPPAPTPRRITTATPKVGSVSSRYEVYPLQIESSSIITGITTVRSNAVDDGYYYTITGQRVSNPGPGFYIRGGKKVIVR